jgi:hypothetical protein
LSGQVLDKILVLVRSDSNILCSLFLDPAVECWDVAKLCLVHIYKTNTRDSGRRSLVEIGDLEQELAVGSETETITIVHGKSLTVIEE